MMTTQNTLVALLGLALCAGSGLAQDRGAGRLGRTGEPGSGNPRINQTAQAGKAGETGERCHRPHPGRPVLTPEEREKLRAAHGKAVQDPAVQQAREQLQEARKHFRETMRAKLLEIDPSLEAILDKLQEARRDHPRGPWRRGPGASAEEDVAAGDID